MRDPVDVESPNPPQTGGDGDPYPNISVAMPSSSSFADSSALRCEPAAFLNLDIGDQIGKAKQLNDFEKSKLLETPWTPDDKYKFPFSEHTKGGKTVRRFVGRQH